MNRSPLVFVRSGLARRTRFARIGVAALLTAGNLWAALPAVAATPAEECPPDLTATLIRQFGHDDATPHLDACKRLPGDPQRAIVALSFLAAPPADAMDDAEMGEYDLDLSIVEVTSARVLQRLERSAVYVSDAVRLTGLTIDTAPYVLAPGQRAFGVRASFTGASRVNPFGQSKLALYLPTASTLRLVLDDLTIGEESGEWDGECAGEFHGLKRVIIIGDTGTHGSADLIVRSTRTEEVHRPAPKRAKNDDDCAVQTSPAKTTRQVLHFDGKHYDLRPLGPD